MIICMYIPLQACSSCVQIVCLFICITARAYGYQYLCTWLELLCHAGEIPLMRQIDTIHTSNMYTRSDNMKIIRKKSNVKIFYLSFYLSVYLSIYLSIYL